VQSIDKFLGEENVSRIVNWTLKYLSDLKLPIKRGTFFEFPELITNLSTANST